MIRLIVILQWYNCILLYTTDIRFLQNPKRFTLNLYFDKRSKFHLAEDSSYIYSLCVQYASINNIWRSKWILYYTLNTLNTLDTWNFLYFYQENSQTSTLLAVMVVLIYNTDAFWIFELFLKWINHAMFNIYWKVPFWNANIMLSKEIDCKVCSDVRILFSMRAAERSSIHKILISNNQYLSHVRFVLNQENSVFIFV